MSMKVPGVDPYTMADYPAPDSQARGGTAQAHAAAAEAHRPPDEAEVREAVETLEQGFRLLNHRLQLSMNQEINRVVVKVIDRTTDKVIREIPPEQIQRMAAKMREMVGLLVDEKI